MELNLQKMPTLMKIYQVTEYTESLVQLLHGASHSKYVTYVTVHH